MEIHERFMKVSTAGMDILELFENFRHRESQIIEELVEMYRIKISRNYLDLRTLQTFRMILCYRYQSLINNYDQSESLERQPRSYVDLRKYFILNESRRKTKEFSLLYDTAVLQLAVSSKTCLKMAFKDFCEAQGSLENIDDVDLNMRVSECFIDGYNLHNNMYGSSNDSEELEQELDEILCTLREWIMRTRTFEWSRFVSILPKLIIAFGSKKIVPPLWECAFEDIEIPPPFTCRGFGDLIGVEKTLTFLCVIADFILPSEISRVEKFHYEQCLENEFWCTINRGLMNKNLQHRKQALYLMKRGLEFLETHNTEMMERLEPLGNRAVPFLCTELDEQALNKIKDQFFQILEILEETAKPLVTAAFDQILSLAQFQANHEPLCKCFDPIWLRCIYERIASHENDSVKVFGLQEILKFDPQIFLDDATRYFFITALNNTYLYEFGVEDNKPPIVNELEASFLRWEQNELDLINAFFKAVPTKECGPIPTYWVLQSMLTVSEKCQIVNNVWGKVEFYAAETVVFNLLNCPDKNLKIILHVMIIRALMAYAPIPARPVTFWYMLYILCSFPENTYFKFGGRNWKNIAEHVSKMVQPADAVNFAVRECEEVITSDQNLKALARMIYLLIDAKLIFVTDTCPAAEALRSLLKNLVGRDVRPSGNRDAISKIIDFAGHLMSVNNLIFDETLSGSEINELMKPYFESILKIVRKSLGRKNISGYEEFVFFVETFLKKRIEDPCDEWITEMINIKHNCILVITNPQRFCKSISQWSFAVKILDIVCRNTRIDDDVLFEFEFIPPMLDHFRCEIDRIGQRENVGQQNRSGMERFPSDCPEAVARLLEFYLTRSSSGLRLLEVDWIASLEALVSIGDGHVVLPVVKILDDILNNHENDAGLNYDTVRSTVRMAWQITFRVEKDLKLRWRNFYHLTELVTSEGFLKIEGCKEYALDCIDQIIREGKKAPLFKRELLNVTWNVDRICTRKLFMSCLFHGVSPHPEELIMRSTISHGFQRIPDLEALHVETTTGIRERAIYFLLSLSDEPEDQDIIFNNLLEVLEENKDKQYDDNSYIHKLKQRVMQTLLVQERILNESQRQRLHDFLCDLLTGESNQPDVDCVRLMHEWLLIRLHFENEDMRETIWELFDTAAQKQPRSIVSLASIVFHVARLLPEETQREYIAKAISRLVLSCMGQQFRSRLYSQVVLIEIYKMLPEDSAEAETYKKIFESVQENLRRRHLKDHSEIVLDDFYFTTFEPFLDFNLETIYYNLPHLTHVSPEELMPDITFETNFFDEENEPSIFFTDARDVLLKARPSASSSQKRDLLELLANLSVRSGSSDVEMRPISWKKMVPLYAGLEEVPEARLLRENMQYEDVGMIVVASLIDSPQVLAGIARTCEIFGSKEFVIGDLKYAEDSEFQNLSLSAEKWITITEVKPNHLQYYLMEKQAEGYELICVEQTANSTNLLEMMFTEKTILLLGNENDGIPGNLLPLVNKYVKIPRNGVVKSLNILVSSALCIWQYAAWHILR